MSVRPHITVATLVERQGRFLMVKEKSDGVLVYNQPAGHLEPGETLVAAAVRETLEETAWEVEITHVLGIYQYQSPLNGISYVRLCFIADAILQRSDVSLDADIESALWMSANEIQSQFNALRSPLVWAAISDYQAQIRYPLDLLSEF